MEEGAPVAKGDVKSLIMQPYHYIRNGNGSEELYDFSTDRSELHDLARRAQEPPALEQCRRTLRAVLPH